MSTKPIRRQRRGRANSSRTKDQKIASSTAVSEVQIPDLRDIFCDHVEGFRHESPEVQLGLTKMFWACVSADGRFTSEGVEFGAHLALPVIKSIWGTFKAMTEAVGYRYFGTLKGDNLSHQANLYYPHPAFCEAFKAFIRSTPLVPMMDRAGAPILRRKPSLPISGTTSSGGRRHGEGQPAPCIPIDLPALARLRDDQLGHACRRSLYHLLTLGKAARVTGEVPVRYVQHGDTGGRLYECHHLQGITRHVRSVALQGLWDYDISNCHFTLISQLIKPFGVCVDTMTHYLSHKRECRTQLHTALASASGQAVDESDVKSAILSLAYGASLGVSPALEKLFANRAVHEAFRQNPWVKELGDELRQCREHILGEFSAAGGGYRIVNAMGFRRAFGPREVNQAFSFVVTGVEARILDSVLRRRGSDIVLCIHDGWVSTTELSISEMEADIYRDTEFEVSIEGGQITEAASPECTSCAEYSKPKKTSMDQWDSPNESALDEIKGTYRARPYGPGARARSCVDEFPGHPNAHRLFDEDFRGGSLYLSRRCSWNVGPNFIGVSARGGRRRRG
jgi:hypothetical protein